MSESWKEVYLCFPHSVINHTPHHANATTKETTMLLKKLTLQFTDSNEINLHQNSISIFVGPNNSGKTFALNEINQNLISPERRVSTKIVRERENQHIDSESMLETIKLRYFRKPHEPDSSCLDLYDENGRHREECTSHNSLVRDIEQKKHIYNVMPNVQKPYTRRFAGKDRLKFAEPHDRGDLSNPVAPNLISHIYRDNKKKNAISEVVYSALRSYLIFDPTSSGQIRFRLSATAPNGQEKSLEVDAIEFMRNSPLLQEQSDGIKAFVSLMLGLHAGDAHTIILDEPELFLHPPLARRVGHEFARKISNNNGTMFCATHSGDFLMGILQENYPINIVRMEYKNGKSRGTLVSPNLVRTVTQHPLMRNSNVISGLFYDGVVVCEADADRVFYSEIYNRLSETGGVIPSLLFVNAQNKQTVKEIVGPLRKCGVPAVGIVDLDVLKESGEKWTELGNAINHPHSTIHALSAERASIDGLFQGAEMRKMMKKEGIFCLKRKDMEAAQNFLDTLMKYGLAIVPCGELECWLKDLGADGKSARWLLSILEKMGNDPSQPDYVRPGDDDVWKFLRTIFEWVQNPSRQGMP